MERHDDLGQNSGSRSWWVALLYRMQLYLVMSQCKNLIPLSVTCSSGSPKAVRTPLSSKLLKRGHIVSCSLCIKEKSTPGNCCFVSCKLRLASHFDQPASRKENQLSGLAEPCAWLTSRSQVYMIVQLHYCTRRCRVQTQVSQILAANCVVQFAF